MSDLRLEFGPYVYRQTKASPTKRNIKNISSATSSWHFSSRNVRFWSALSKYHAKTLFLTDVTLSLFEKLDHIYFILNWHEPTFLFFSDHLTRIFFLTICSDLVVVAFWTKLRMHAATGVKPVVGLQPAPYR